MTLLTYPGNDFYVGDGLLDFGMMIFDQFLTFNLFIFFLSFFVCVCGRIFKYAQNFMFMGRGYQFPVALEGALKLKEISYIHAEGYPAAEMKHGPLALIDQFMPVIMIAPKSDPTYEKTKANIEEVIARQGSVIAITEEGNHELDHQCEHVIRVPVVPEPFAPILTVIPLQLMSYYIADLRGCSIDQPRNLAKSVTVE